MKIKTNNLPIADCYSAEISRIEDARGDFIKVFHADTIQGIIPGFQPKEMYITSSRQNVLRGMHLQLPPDDHAKLVICLGGRVTDVLLDLRAGRGFGTITSAELTAHGTNCMIIPKGVAHGFYAHDDGSILLYLVETMHSPENDIGIKWDSIGFKWPVRAPIVSERDQNHTRLEDFSPPLAWTEKW